MSKKENNRIFIVPHTHWDREWYEPFQIFRFKLVKLIDLLCESMVKKSYYFLLDGQTVVLEDYFEMRPEKRDILLNLIRKGNVIVGPWYVLPDEWLVGGESLIRNLEMSIDLANDFDIPLMPIGYLPDQFGHTSYIPQLLGDLTNYPVAVIWRGVGEEINNIFFHWKKHSKALKGIDCIYLPNGYGNAASLPEDESELRETINDLVNDLKPYSPFPVFLLMNGTDHQFPNPVLYEKINAIKDSEADIKISTLTKFYQKLKEVATESNYQIQTYCGEFRSPTRAPLLQDTYSTRIWIKQWNQRNEDLLTRYAEPIATYFWYLRKMEYPHQAIRLAWKWLLKNHPHDSICGCSIDRVHEEMLSRFSWSETLAEGVIKDSIDKLIVTSDKERYQVIVWNPSNNENEQYFEFSLPIKIQVGSLERDGKLYPVQPIAAKEEVFFEQTMSPFKLRAGLKLLPGRKIADIYINDTILHEYPEIKKCEIIIICDKHPVGEFDINELKKQASELINSKKYNSFHVKILKGAEQRYACVAPLYSWSFNIFTVSRKQPKSNILFKNYPNALENDYYSVELQKDGSLKIYDKKLNTCYPKMHFFEDVGDRGDEYTFSKVMPSRGKIKNLKRKLVATGPVFAEIKLTYNLITFQRLTENRDKRTGKTKIPMETTLRLYYGKIPRIDFKTTLLNTAQDHRLRVCFSMPFSVDTTLTSTHFGVVKRPANPPIGEDYEEQPSTVQPQKRFIRIENPYSDEALTLINKGLPEVAIEDNYILSLTLLRSVGFLSRSDFPERPVTAGPFLATPGAQELFKEYTYEYSIFTHSKDIPLYQSENQAENFCLQPLAFVTQSIEINVPTLCKLDNHWIRISSLRCRNANVLVTLFNLSDSSQQTSIYLDKDIIKCYQIKIDGTIVKEYKIDGRDLVLSFDPFEIKMLMLEKK